MIWNFPIVFFMLNYAKISIFSMVSLNIVSIKSDFGKFSFGITLLVFILLFQMIYHFYKVMRMENFNKKLENLSTDANIQTKE